MGIGLGNKIKIVVLSESAGVDGPEPISTEVANTYAQVNYQRQRRQFEAGRVAFVTEYEFLVRYATELDGVLNINCMVEYNNRRYQIGTIERGDIVPSRDKFNPVFRHKPEGRYWRIVAGSNDIS